MGKILETAQGKVFETPPIWMMRQAGRHLPEYLEIRKKTPDFLDLCLSPALATEITLQPIRRYQMDGAILFSDILILPYLLGQNVWFEKGFGPRLEPINHDLAKKLDFHHWEMKAQPVYETVERVRDQLPEKTDLIGFAGGPWTVLTYMINGKGGNALDAIANYLENQVFFDELLENLALATAKHLVRQIRAGADLVMLFESWAGGIGPMLEPKLLLEPMKKMMGVLRSECPNIPIILFPRGLSELSLIDYCEELKPDVAALDTAIELQHISPIFEHVSAVQGNLDPFLLVLGGTSLDQAVEEILEAMQGRAHIFNLGHGVRPETPIAHVERVLDLVRGKKGSFG